MFPVLGRAVEHPFPVLGRAVEHRVGRFIPRYFRLMNEARKEDKKSFVYNGNTYVQSKVGVLLRLRGGSTRAGSRNK